MTFGATGRCPACNKYHDRCTCNGKVPLQIDNLDEVLAEQRAKIIEAYTVPWETLYGQSDVFHRASARDWPPFTVEGDIEFLFVDAQPSHADLKDCAANVAALYRNFDHREWFIDRMFGMDFICDQCLPDLDMRHHMARITAPRRYGFTDTYI